MTFILYNNTSPPNKVDKSISEYRRLSGVAREPFSVTDPIILVELPEGPTNFNYANIIELGRYYYVTGISCVNATLYAVSLHVDVLMTYSNQIRSAYAVVKRQENKYNLYLDDGIFKAYQNTKHKIITFPNGFNGFSYVLALAGNDSLRDS